MLPRVFPYALQGRTVPKVASWRSVHVKVTHVQLTLKIKPELPPGVAAHNDRFALGYSA